MIVYDIMIFYITLYFISYFKLLKCSFRLLRASERQNSALHVAVEVGGGPEVRGSALGFSKEVGVLLGGGSYLRLIYCTYIYTYIHRCV